MSPEFGSTCAIFPIDAETLRYLRADRPADRDDRAGRRLRPRAGDVPRAGTPRTRSSPTTLELDLGDVEPSIAGPKRPQDRVPLAQAKEAFLEAMEEFDPEAAEQLGNGLDEADEESFPASDPPAEDHDVEGDRPRPAVTGGATATIGAAARTRSRSRSRTGPAVELDHGRVVIAAITSCTNTSNPSVMVGAGLLARNAVERGLDAQALGEDLARAGLDGRHRLPPEGRPDRVPRPAPVQSRRVRVHDLHRQLRAAAGRDLGRGRGEGPGRSARCSPATATSRAGSTRTCKANYLASPPLVVAYALAGRMDIDLASEPLGQGSDGEPVYLRDIWPSAEEIKEVVGRSIASEMFTRNYGEVLGRGRELERGRGSRGRPLHLARLDLRPPPLLLRRDAGGGAGGRADRGGAGPRPARRLDHHRPHLTRRGDQEGQSRRPVADRGGRRAPRLQLLRLAARQPRGDDPRHLRQHPPPQPPGRARRAASPATSPTARR